jgi:hypothetical protein
VTARAGAPCGRCGVRQGGQVLPLALPLLVLLGLCLWWVLDAAMAVSEKRRLVHAADMAALSGAVWQARTLNFDAYMNRAIIANEAVIAQSVSLRSFSDHAHQLMQNSSVVTTWVPFLGQALRILERSWAGIHRALGEVLSALETLTSVVNHDLALAQRTLHVGALQAVPAVVKDTVQRIDPRFELTPGADASLNLWQVQWPRFASFYGGAFRWRQQDVVYRSLDGFSAERQYRWPGTSAFGFRIERRGATELINFESWRALDTLSLHLRRYIVFGSLRERIPLGWGMAAIGGRRLRPPRRTDFAGAYRVNPRAARLAERSAIPRYGYLGLPSLYDLSVAQRDVFSPHPVTLRLRLSEDQRRRAFDLWPIRMPDLTVSGSVSDAESTSNANSTPAASKHFSPTAGDFFAEASASVWFAPAYPRADQQPEAPSLFSPHWQARWQTVSQAERLALATLDGTPLSLAGATP